MGVVVGVLAVTITKGSLFNKFRDYMWRRGEFLGDLFSCPYCIAHYLAIAIVLCGNWTLIFQPYYLLIQVCMVIAISMIVGLVVYKSYRGIVDVPDLSGENQTLRELIETLRNK